MKKHVIYRCAVLLSAFMTSTAVLAENEAKNLLEALFDPMGTVDESAAGARPARDFQSTSFGYRFRADARWFDWSDLASDAPVADMGALGSGNAGVNVVPVCWDGAPPPVSAVYRVMMQQASEDYPSPFVQRDEDIKKGSANGKLLVGSTPFEGEDFDYYHWIVANENCAYLFAGWGPSSDKALEKRLTKLWDTFQIGMPASAAKGIYHDAHSARVAALLSNAFGLHFYEVRSYREAFRFFASANKANPNNVDYLTNAVRSLSSINAYSEANTWLNDRVAPFADNQVVISWQAWLAARTGNADKAIALYAPLFANGYRDDEDFTVYTNLLADRREWAQIDALFETYSADGATPALEVIRAGLLAKRGEPAAALKVLDALVDPNVLDADLAFERLSIMDDMDAANDMLALSDALIAAGYRSLQSYFYKGRAEYQLGNYTQAKTSFLAAQEFAPGNDTVRDYLAAIDRTLGQGDVAMISESLDPVKAPRSIQKILQAKRLPPVPAETAADFVYDVLGYAFDDSDVLRRSLYRKIRIIDERGVADFSTIESDFDPAYEKLFVNSLVVRDANGDVVGQGDLSSYYITTTTDGYEASTERTAHMPVPGLAPGVTIELLITKHINIDAGVFPFETVYLSNDRPSQTSALFVTGNADKIRYESFKAPQPKRIGDALIWSMEQPEAYRWEPLQPYYDKMVSWVQLGSIQQDWTQVGREYLEQISEKLNSESVAKRARRLIEGVTDQQRQIDILSAYVQEEIQYKALEFGRRAYIPKTASETLRDRYGDCKDHAVLLNDMLTAVGIDSSLALVSLQQQVLPSLPNRDQFDHMIVTASTTDARRFIDTTDKNLRLGQLSPRYMGKNYALVLAAVPELVRMPEYDTVSATIDIARDVEVQPDGVVSVSERMTLSGYHAAQLRGQLRGIETSEMRDALQRWLNIYLPDAELQDYFVENIFDADFDLIVELQFSLSDVDDGVVSVPGFGEIAYLEYDRVADRRFTFELVYPLKLTSVSRLRTGKQYELSGDIDVEQSASSRYGKWQRRIEPADDGAVIRFDFFSEAAQFDAKEYRPFTDFQKKAARAVRTPLSKTL